MLDLQSWRHPKRATGDSSCPIFFFSLLHLFQKLSSKVCVSFSLPICMLVIIFHVSRRAVLPQLFGTRQRWSGEIFDLPISIITILVLLVLTANTSSSNPLLRQLHDHPIWFKDSYPLAQLASFHSVSKRYAWLIHELWSFVEIKDNPGDPLLSARLLRRSMALIGPDQ